MDTMQIVKRLEKEDFTNISSGTILGLTVIALAILEVAKTIRELKLKTNKDEVKELVDIND